MQERAWNPGAEASAAAAARHQREWRRKRAQLPPPSRPVAGFFDGALPVELFERCLALCDPFTLLRLMTLSKAANRFVGGRDRRAVWERMLARYGILGLCPVGMSLPRYTNSAFAMFCVHCGSDKTEMDYTNANASFTIELVLCGDCQDEEYGLRSVAARLTAQTRSRLSDRLPLGRRRQYRRPPTRSGSPDRAHHETIQQPRVSGRRRSGIAHALADILSAASRDGR